MTVPAPRARRRPSTLGRLLPLLLVAALLAPLGLLVTSNWRQTTDDRDLAARERLGVQYLAPWRRSPTRWWRPSPPRSTAAPSPGTR